MASPYENLNAERFWKQGVAKSNPRKMTGLHTPRWEISDSDTIVTMGSCFAQHIAVFLRDKGLKVPFYDTSENIKSRIFSANYGNIYTVRQALQLVEEVAGKRPVNDEFWPSEDGYVDPLRPNVFERPVKSKSELAALRVEHLAAIREALQDLDVLIFTLGLTEAWIIEQSKRVLPVAPGVVAGEYHSDQHSFHNFTHDEVAADLKSFCKEIENLRKGKPFKLILTVSPVPLTATYEDRHVLQSTTYSKSVLRVVAGEFVKKNEFADYFPSFEIVNNPAAKSSFFEANLRSVRSDAVDVVMKHFCDVYLPRYKGAGRENQNNSPGKMTTLDVDCEETLIKGFEQERGVNAFSTDDMVVTFGDSHLTATYHNIVQRDEAPGFAFAPVRLLANNPGSELATHGLRTFIFKKEHSNFHDFFVQNPKNLVMVGMGFFGDNIIRAHGDMHPEREADKRARITPELPHIEQVTKELVRFYMLKMQKNFAYAMHIENLTAYERIFWIVSPDMPEQSGRFRLGDAFVDGGYYKVHKAAYLTAFNLWKDKLQRTTFIMHPWDQLCAENGFTKDRFRGPDNPGNIHCSPDYFRSAVDELMGLLKEAG